MLKDTLNERTNRLRCDRVDGVPSAQEFCEALMALDGAGLKPAIALIAVHSRRPDAAATMEELARLADRDESATATMTIYTRFARDLSTFLEFVPEVNGYDWTLAPVLTFAVPETQPRKSGPALRFRLEMLEAFHTWTAGMNRLVSDRAICSRDCNLCPVKSNGENVDATSQFDGNKLGTLIQSYARGRWYAGPEKQEAGSLETQLERGLRDRIDALGVDFERLLPPIPRMR